MIPTAAIPELLRILGPERLVRDRPLLETYGHDSTELQAWPDAVAFPQTVAEISAILKLANQTPFFVVPRGAGTGKTGGAVPIRGGLVLSLERFNRILEIDTDNLIARVEPGVITAHLQEAVERLGLFYPPDPASLNESTLGGNVAHCAGGLRAVKYGVTRDFVLGLKAVLPTGEIINTGVRTAKGVAGYDLTRLIVGSEGTLAVIAEITLRLIPKPAVKKTMSAFFATAAEAVASVAEIIRRRVIPVTLELLDRYCLDCVRRQNNFTIPSAARALLLIEVDGEEPAAASEAAQVKELCLQAGALAFETAIDPAESVRMWETRRNISKIIDGLAANKISEDVVVPRSRLADLITFLERLGEQHGLPVLSYGHAGDGNLHVNILFDKSIPVQAAAAETMVRELFREVLEMKGTLTGEHGIGLTKAPYLAMELTAPVLELMTRVKKSFDPNGILNPGKIFSAA
jgi:glycolate oxidase